MTTEPTTGAMKAALDAYCIAKDIYPTPTDMPGRAWSNDRKNKVREIAALIDRETGLPELVEALRETLDEYIGQAELPPEDERALEKEGLGVKHNPIVKKAQAALAKHEGKE